MLIEDVHITTTLYVFTYINTIRHKKYNVWMILPWGRVLLTKKLQCACYIPLQCILSVKMSICDLVYHK